jgi:acyl-CoA thioester hydrolase
MPERTPAEPARSAPPVAVFRRERTVSDEDTDALGHVNNVIWVRWLIELTEAHAAAVGLPVGTIRTMGGVWVVHKQELDYHRGALPGETLRESTWVSEMHGATTVRHKRIENAALRARCARGPRSLRGAAGGIPGERSVGIAEPSSKANHDSTAQLVGPLGRRSASPPTSTQWLGPARWGG